MSKTEIGAYDALVEKGQDAELSAEGLSLYSKERAYRNQCMQWSQYQDWKKNRNPARAAMEAESGFDRKHGMHLIRLMKMCKEILQSGKVIVKRHDREQLLSIRNGGWSYEQVVETAELLEAECDALYLTSTVLPKSPDLVKIDKFCVDLTERVLKVWG